MRNSHETKWTSEWVPRALVLFLFPFTLQSFAAVVTRGPYLQTGTPDSMTVRWRTDVAVIGEVRYGSAQDALTSATRELQSTTEHIVKLTGLSAYSAYFYSVGVPGQVLSGGDSHHVFRTSPFSGSTNAMRFWVIGDSGTANDNARAVRDAFDKYNGNTYVDAWLMLGDNAYNSGTDSEYQAAVFEMYPNRLIQTALWPTYGNHDARSADSPTQSGAYYNIFSLPRQGEAGGVASKTEAWYSFDYGNVHFVCLDSFESNRTKQGDMLSWLERDLTATTQTWLIAYWHHPPYTKGSHDSDREGILIDMRSNVIPILEAHGVDLVLTGHSHSYERSYLLNGHYGLSGTFHEDMKLDKGDGNRNGDGAYRKISNKLSPHEGAVYIVAGSSGKISGGPLNHPAMFMSVNQLGSLVLDVAGTQLDAIFVDVSGSELDRFRITKGN